MNKNNIKHTASFLTRVLLCVFLLAPVVSFSMPKPVINLIEEEKKLEQTSDEEHADGAGAENEEGATEDEYDGLYKIELLVFAYVNTGEENSEIWRNLERPEFNEFHPAYLPQPKSEQQNESNMEDSTSSSKYLFLNLEDENVSEFKDILKKMAINGHYRTLQHLVWQQKVLDENENDLFYLEGGNYYPSYEDILEKQSSFQTLEEQTEETNEPLGNAELAGTIKLYRSRFLHIKPDLWFTEFAINDAGMCLEDGSITEATHTQANASYTALTNFHITQHRRLRSGVLHYIDHPRFGFLIKFTSVEKPQENKIQTEN